MRYTIVGLSGSTRSASSNTALIRLAQRIASEAEFDDVNFEHHTELQLLPFYNADLEEPSLTPDVVSRWRALIEGCHGVFIASPEYNFGTTALLKNAIDWVSRPPGDHALNHKVISLISSSASTGGKHMIEQYTHVFTILGNNVVAEPDGSIVKGAQRISADGSTIDDDIDALVRSRLSRMMAVLRSDSDR